MKRFVLIVDELYLASQLRDTLMEYYADHLEVVMAVNAGEAMEIVRKKMPHVMVTEILLPYGTARAELDAWTDPHEWETGIRLIDWVMKPVPKGMQGPLVFVTTACCKTELPQEFLAQHGKMLYLKPFDTFVLEVDICQALGIPCKVPQGLLDAGRLGR